MGLPTALAASTSGPMARQGRSSTIASATGFITLFYVIPGGKLLWRGAASLFSGREKDLNHQQFHDPTPAIVFTAVAHGFVPRGVRGAGSGMALHEGTAAPLLSISPDNDIIGSNAPNMAGTGGSAERDGQGGSASLHRRRNRQHRGLHPRAIRAEFRSHDFWFGPGAIGGRPRPA